MVHITEQQVSEFLSRCETLREITSPAVFTRIDALVRQIAANNGLSNDEVKELYALLRQSTEIGTIKSEEVAPDWDDAPRKEHVETEHRKERNLQNHLLLCNWSNLRTIEAMRKYIKSITTPAIAKGLEQANKPGR
jgi:DNA-binding transcriptional MerR regulator